MFQSIVPLGMAINMMLIKLGFTLVRMLFCGVGSLKIHNARKDAAAKNGEKYSRKSRTVQQQQEDAARWEKAMGIKR